MDSAIIQQLNDIELSLRDAHGTVQAIQHLIAVRNEPEVRNAYLIAARMMCTRIANELMSIQAQLKGGDK